MTPCEKIELCILVPLVTWGCWIAAEIVASWF